MVLLGIVEMLALLLIIAMCTTRDKRLFTWLACMLLFLLKCVGEVIRSSIYLPLFYEILAGMGVVLVTIADGEFELKE